MAFKRLITGLLTAGLVGVTPLAVSAPAHAVATYSTKGTINISTQTVADDGYSAQNRPAVTVQWGDVVDIEGQVTDNTGANPYNGLAYLQASTKSDPTWRNVGTIDHFGFMYFPNLRPTETTFYRVYYAGYNGGTSSDSWTPSYSNVVYAAVAHKVKWDTRASSRLILRGKVSPDFAYKKVVVKVMKAHHWRRYKVVRTTRLGKFSVKFYARRGHKTRFMTIVPAGSSKYIDNNKVWITHVW